MRTDLRWTWLAAALLGACGGDDDDSSSTGQGGTSASGSGGSSAGGTSAGGAAGVAGAAAGQGGTMSGRSGQGGGVAGSAGSAGSGPPGAACPGLVAGPTGHLTGQTLKVGALDRTYSLDVPAVLDPARRYPVVFVFHGDGGDGEGIRGGYGFGAVAGNDAIFVYPDATVDSGRSFDIEKKAASNLDIAFFDALTASLGQSYCVDPARVFAAGMSRGGFFASWLGCQRGDRLRAIAPHSGSIYSADNEYTDEGIVSCPTAAPAAIVLHGDADSVVPFKDGEFARYQWATSNGCGDTTKPFDPSPCVAHDGCKVDHPVVWCAIPGLGHDIWQKATQATWNFFKPLL